MRAAAAGLGLTTLGLFAAAGCRRTPWHCKVSSRRSSSSKWRLPSEIKSCKAARRRSTKTIRICKRSSPKHNGNRTCCRTKWRPCGEQLSSTTSQLAQARQDKQLVEKNAQAVVASTKRRAGALITPNNSLKQNLPNLTLPGVEVRQDGDTVRFELSTDRLFTPGTAQLRQDAPQLLDAVAAEIERTYPEQIIGVEGHTDSDPPGTSPPQSPHQFSTSLAMSLFDYLTARTHLRPNQLFLVGHGGNHPVVSNATPAGKARNRRVELVIYPDKLGQ